MQTVFDKQALFSDGTKDYRTPVEPEAGNMVTIRFRTGKDNVDRVWLMAGKQQLEMEKQESAGGFDYYSAGLQLGEEEVRYYFKIESGDSQCFYDRTGVSNELREDYFFAIVPGFSTPDWAKGAVMYQILVDRFYNGDPQNDVLNNEYYYIKTYSRHVENWRKKPENFDVADFYGGDLKGVLKKLDYLKELGVEVIYFNPIFVSPSNHKYDIQDYDYIDPHFGVIEEDGGEVLPCGCRDNTAASCYRKRVTDKKNLEASNRFFISFVEEVHKRGMRVILDGVFNHCGSFNKWMDRERIYEGQEGYETGAFLSSESPYRDFFRFADMQAWPDNATYDGWWGHNTLPKLNYEGSGELYHYILEIGKKWVLAPYHADGWRLDVAADLGHSPEFNHQFWRDFRRAVKEANPDALILAEHYGDPREWLKGDQWDTVMNYDAFMEPISWFLTGMEKHSDEYREDKRGNYKDFENAMTHFMTRFMTPSLYCAMNELSNHDHSRFLTRTNHKAGRAAQLGCEAAGQGVDRAIMKEAVLFQMTWPGAPTVYYGDEAGVCGFTDPDNRRTYPWGEEEKELLLFHREMIRIHRKYEAFRTGSVRFLDSCDYLLCYGRFTRKEQFLVVINSDACPHDVDVSVLPMGISEECRMEQIMYTTIGHYSTACVTYPVQEQRLRFTLPGKSAVILRRI